jgi:hypothetical protein
VRAWSFDQAPSIHLVQRLLFSGDHIKLLSGCDESKFVDSRDDALAPFVQKFQLPLPQRVFRNHIFDEVKFGPKVGEVASLVQRDQHKAIVRIFPYASFVANKERCPFQQQITRKFLRKTRHPFPELENMRNMLQRLLVGTLSHNTTLR